MCYSYAELAAPGIKPMTRDAHNYFELVLRGAPEVVASKANNISDIVQDYIWI